MLRAARGAAVNASFKTPVASQRTSCAKPNLQQLPKSGGVRECFVARPGALLCSVDYNQLELCTLAQVCLEAFGPGSSKMADAILAMVQLTPGERQTVMGVVERMRFTPTEASETVAKPAKLTRHSQPFSDYEREMVAKYAALYSRATTRQRQKIYREAAATLGRSLESVKKVIRIARKELESKQEATK